MSYREEFLQQYSHYQSLRDIFLMNPNPEQGEEFGDLIGFVSAVCTCYSKETAEFPEELKKILLDNHRDLTPDLREKIISCLTMLRNKNVISPESLIKTLFPLLQVYSSKASNASTLGNHSKAIRSKIYSTLISLLKAVNTGSKNQKVNKTMQALLFGLLEQRDAQGLWATKLTRELWRRGIWDDSRTVEIMTHAALHNDVKVAVAGVRFFLGADKERNEALEEDSSDEEVDMSALRHQMKINKKSSKRGKKLESAVKSINKKSSKQLGTHLNFSAIHLLRDPQGFAELLFETHLAGTKGKRFDLDQKILIMNLISRLVGTHKLTVLGIYTYFMKFLTPKQRNVTQIMAAAAQASHDLVPPEAISDVVRKIADEFVSEGVASEVAAAGINTIREILTRAPLAIDEALLQDLVEYKGSKAKPVMLAAKSLLSLYRTVAPEMLRKKDRGKAATMGLSLGERQGLPTFGVESGTITSIPGIELLAKWKEEQGDEDDEKEWEVASDVDSDEIDGDWVNVASDDEINISDSDDEKEHDQDKEKEKEDEDSDLDLSDEEPPVKKAKTDTMTEMLSSRILTPADFAKLRELRMKAGVEEIMGVRNEEEVDHSKLVGKVKWKQNYEERMEHVKEGRDDEKHGLRKGKRETDRSTTNKEKERKKNFVMMIHKRAVQGKKKLSLRDRQKVLRAHIDKQKKKGF